MRCTSCGYEYPDNQLKCPFCGTENTAYARAQQQEVLDALQEESKHIQTTLPKELCRTTDRKVLKTGALVLAGILFLLLLTLIGSFLYRISQEQKESKNLKKLETQLAEQDFAGLAKTLDKIDNSYASVYEKYEEVASVYEDLSYGQESLKDYYDFTSSGHLTSDQLSESLSWALSSFLNAYWNSEQALQDSLILENEDSLELLQSEIVEILTDTLLLTEEEIAETQPQNTSWLSSEDVLFLAQLSHERMTQK